MLQEALQLAHTTVNADLKAFFSTYARKVSPLDRWSEDVISRLEEYALRPGKAIRPLLVAVGAAVASGKPLAEVLQDQSVRRLMMVMELTHKRLILADDIADQDDMRNEREAFHILFEHDLQKRPQYAKLSGEQRRHIARSYSEVAGIWLQALTWKILEESEFSSEKKLRATQILLERVYENTSAGWYILLDQNFETLAQQESEERLLKGLELVTGEYTFVAPLLLGAMVMDGSAESATALEMYGQKAGLLFQITDDMLGLFGDPQVTGKPSGNDIREGKKTLLVQFAYRAGTSEQKAFLESVVGKSNVTVEEIEQVRHLVNETGAREETTHVISTLVDQAVQSTSTLPTSAEQKLLQELVQFLALRQK